MKKLIAAAMIGGVAGVFVSTQLAGPLIAQETTRLKSTYEHLDLFGDIFERIRSSYVEQVDEEELIRSAITGMLESLDPHSGYLPPEDFSSMQVQTQGEFGGLGIEVTEENGVVKVVSPIDDTPAAEAGIQANDLIIQVNGESTLDMTLDESVDKMRGPVGSEIVITIAREGETEPFDVTIVRDIIEIKAVRGRTEGDVVVMRISAFTEKTTPNLEESIKKQIESLGGIESVAGFVVDLRNNPGGLLSEAISVSDAFLDAGEIVSTRGRNDGNAERWNARVGDLAEGKPIVVLVNGGSASASEIVAGALKDHRRAIIVGERTFGKGSVQTVMPLQSDGAIRLTTALYFTPSGRSIQALGVAPDIIVERELPEPVEESEEVDRRSEASLDGALENTSLTDDQKAQFEKELLAEEAAEELRNADNQMAYALDVIKSLTVLKE
ncbi:MAG: S41 family peptidase [Pseudomonadota bacterium]